MRFNPEGEAFKELTRRPFIVMDTETTIPPDDEEDDAPAQRLVSYAYTVVENGVYTRAKSYTSLVNPGVPIHKNSTRIHGITDKDVAGKRDFKFHARRLTQVLSTPGAVLVAHNANFDVGVLINEYKLIGQTMPDLPVIDTMYLPRTVSYTAGDLPRQPSLTLLCEVIGVKLDQHHDADADTTATAKCLLALLRHTAGVGHIVEITELLEEHARATTLTMKSSAYISTGEASAAVDIPVEHRVKHRVPLDSNPSRQDLTDWLDRALECAELYCPLLAPECEAAIPHAGLLFTRMRKNTSTLTEPGQYATLAGGLMRMLAPTNQPRQEAQWLYRSADAFAKAPRCRGRQSCPDCRESRPCPLDVAHEYAAKSALLDDAGQLTGTRLDGALFKSPPKGQVYRWTKVNWALAAHVAYLAVMSQVIGRNPVKAEAYTQYAVALDLHKVDAHLALRVAQQYLGRGQVDDAEKLLLSVLRPESTNPVNKAVGDALILVAAHRVKLAEEAARGPVFENKSRPAERVRRSRFALPGV
jgi:DNA polymerase-3 subunit epsilon